MAMSTAEKVLVGIGALVGLSIVVGGVVELYAVNKVTSGAGGAGATGLPLHVSLSPAPQGLFPVPIGTNVIFDLPANAQWATTGWASATSGFGPIGAPGTPIEYVGGGGQITLNWTVAGEAGTATIDFQDS